MAGKVWSIPWLSSLSILPGFASLKTDWSFTILYRDDAEVHGAAPLLCVL